MSPVDIQYRVIGADQVASSLQQMENHARQMATTMTGVMAPAHSATRALSSAVMGATQVARLAGDSAKDFANKIDTLAIAVVSASVVVQALRGITLSWAATLGVARVALAALTGPIGLLVIGLTALTAGLLVVNDQFGKEEEKAHRLAEALVPLTAGLSLLWEKHKNYDTAVMKAIKNADDIWIKTTQFTASLVPLAGSLEIATMKVIDYGIHLQQAGAQLNAFADKMRAVDVQDQATAIGEAADRQRAYAGALTTTEAQLRAVIGTTATQIRQLTETRDAAGADVELKKRLSSQIEGLKTQLVGYNNQLAAEHRHLQSLNDDTIVQMALYDRRKADIAAAVRLVGFERDAVIGLKNAQEELDAIVRQNEIDREKALASAEKQKQGFLEEADALAEVNRVFGDRENVQEIARQAMDRMKMTGQSLQKVIEDLKFALDFQRELDALDAGFNNLNIAVGKAKINVLDIKFGLEDMAIDTLPSVLKALGPMEQAFQNFATTAAPILREAFTNLFSDILTSAKSFGDALLDFFRNIVNAIANAFASKLAGKIVSLLLPGFASGGIVSGLSPMMAFQGGGIINRPTLAMVGEGGEREAVIPEHLWPAFNAGRGGSGPREVVVNVNVVADVSQIPRTSPGDIQATVVLDLRTNGPISRQIRQTIPR